MGVYTTIDPATGEQVAQYQELSRMPSWPI